MEFKMISNNDFLKLSINKKREYVESLISEIGYKDFINSDVFKILSSNKKFNKYLFYLKKVYSDDLEFLNFVFNTNHQTFDLLLNPNLDLKLTEKLIIEHAKGLDKKHINNLKEFKNVNIDIILNTLKVNNLISFYVMDIFKDSKDFELIIDLISNENYNLYMDSEHYNSPIIIKNFEKLSNNGKFNYFCYDNIQRHYFKNYYKSDESFNKDLYIICDLFLIHSLNKINFENSFIFSDARKKVIDFAKETRNSIFK